MIKTTTTEPATKDPKDKPVKPVKEDKKTGGAETKKVGKEN